jgi:hypothetical protein
MGQTFPAACHVLHLHTFWALLRVAKQPFGEEPVGSHC